MLWARPLRLSPESLSAAGWQLSQGPAHPAGCHGSWGWGARAAFTSVSRDYLPLTVTGAEDQRGPSCRWSHSRALAELLLKDKAVVAHWFPTCLVLRASVRGHWYIVAGL